MSTDFNPITDLPTGVQLSFCGSAFVIGTRDFPLSDIPLADMIAKAGSGTYKAKPVRVFRFSEIGEAHRAMESGLAAGEDGCRRVLTSPHSLAVPAPARPAHPAHPAANPKGSPQ